MTDTPKSVSRSTLSFLSGTFLSRVTGLGRDVTMAFCFGSHPAVAAFMVAFRFAHLIRRLFGEGPLPSGFIPHFVELNKESQQKGALFFRDLYFSLAAVLVGIVAVGMVGLAVLWKWGSFSPGASQILYLTLLMLPGVIFICLSGLSSGLLQCERKFFVTGFAPAIFNLVWIGAAWFLKDKEPSSAMVFLSLAVVAAFAMQWLPVSLLTVKFLRCLSWKERFKAKLFSLEMRQVVKPVLLSVVGVAAVQVNTALDGVFARFASLEGPAYLWYAIRLQQLPLALFGIALSSAIFPALARAVREGTGEHYARLLRFAYRRSFSLIFPCTMGIFVLGGAAVNLIYGRGDFSSSATDQTVMCLWGYGMGLVPAVFVLFLAPAFYAKRDYRTPMAASIYSVLVNGALSAFFVFGLHWGAFSIAVATSCSAWVNYLYLSRRLNLESGALVNREVMSSWIRTAGSALLAALATGLVGAFLVEEPTLRGLLRELPTPFSRVFSVQLLEFLALFGTFGLILFSYAWLFEASDVLELVGVKRKIEAAPPVYQREE